MAQQDLFTARQFGRTPGPQQPRGGFIISMSFSDTAKWVREISPMLEATFLVVCKVPNA